MSKLLDLRKRLGGIYNVDKIIKAMQTVTLAKVRRSQQGLKNCRAYFEALAGIISQNFEALAPFNQIFEFKTVGKKKKNHRILLVLFTANRSFSGDFTEKIFLKANEFRRQNPDKNIFYLPVGKKGEQLIRHGNFPATSGPRMPEQPVLTEARQFGANLREKFQKEEFGEIYLVYNRFRSILFQEPEIIKIFPVPEELKPKTRSQKLFFYEPNLADFGRDIFEKYLTVKIYETYFESFASELAARMINLRSASESSKELIKTLSIQINKARQSRITEELTEIVSSYELIREGAV